MSEITKVEANIFGSDYTIAGDASEEYIRSITVFVDARMRELAKVFPQASPLKLAVLAAINITDEMFQNKEVPTRGDSEVEKAVEQKARKLISMLDRGLIGE